MARFWMARDGSKYGGAYIFCTTPLENFDDNVRFRTWMAAKARTVKSPFGHQTDMRSSEAHKILPKELRLRPGEGPVQIELTAKVVK